MDPIDARLLTDKVIILCGALAVIGGIIGYVLSATGKASISNSSVGFIVIGAVFVWYGIKTLKSDKERFHR